MRWRLTSRILEGLTLWWGLVGPRQGIGWGCGRCRRIALEAEGAEDLGEPGAEGGVGEDFETNSRRG